MVRGFMNFKKKQGMTRYTPPRGDSIGRRCPRRAGRRGFLTLEFVLLLPVLVLVFAGMVQLACMLMAKHAIHGAAAVGAREAALPGADPVRVQAAVKRALAPWRFSNAVNPVRVQAYSGDFVETPLSSARGGDAVAVTVSVPTREATPRVLSWLGETAAGDSITATYVARIE